jgi:hypothetical protein
MPQVDFNTSSSLIFQFNSLLIFLLIAISAVILLSIALYKKFGNIFSNVFYRVGNKIQKNTIETNHEISS